MEKLAAEVCLECRHDVDGVDVFCMGIRTSVKDTRRPTLAKMRLVMPFARNTALIRGSDVLDEDDTEEHANR